MPVGGPLRTTTDDPFLDPVVSDLPRADVRPGRPGRELARIVAVAAVPTLVYVAVVLRNLTYAWDDFVEFGVTMEHGVGRELLTYGLFEHFGPANRLAHGLLVTHAGLDTRWAIALAAPIFFAYCAALTDLARVLGAGWGRVALCLAVATVTPSTVFVGAFLDPYLHVMVPVAATAAATAAYVRWVRTRRAVHVVTGALAVVLACAVQERGVFIVVFLALARVLVIEGGRPPGRWMGTWVRTWWRDAPFLLLPVLVAGATAVVVALEYVADAPRGGLVETAALVMRAWAVQFVPMMTGTYGLGAGHVRGAVVVLANAAVLALLVWTVRRNAWNLRPWLLLLAWFGFTMTYLGLGRLGIGSADSIIADPNYCTYSLPAAVMLIATLRGGRAPGTVRTRAGANRWARFAPAAATVVLAGLVLVSVLPWAKRHENYSPGYLHTAVHDVLAASGSGGAVVAPTRVPNHLVPPGFYPYNSGELFLREIDPRTTVDVDPEAPLFLADTGRLTEATAVLLARMEPGAVGSRISTEPASRVGGNGDLCMSADDTGRVSAPLDAPVDLPGGAAWVRIVATGEDTLGTAALWDGTAWSTGASGPLVTAHGSVSFVLLADRVSQVELVDVRAERLCIQAIEVWVLRTDGPTGCAWVGPRGERVVGDRPGSPPTCAAPGAAPPAD